MINYVQNKDIDREKWDRLIRSSENATIFNLSWYLDVVTEYSWDALIQGDYESVMPLPISKKAGVKVLYLPFFMRETDVFGGGDRKEFLRKTLERFKLIQIGFSGRMENAIDHCKAKSTTLVYQALLLDQDYKTIRAAYSKNAKRMVNKAEKSGFSLRELSSGAPIVDLFLETKGEDISELRSKDFDRLKSLMEVSLQHNSGIALGVFSEQDELVAGGFYLFMGKTITYLKGATLHEVKKQGAGYLCMDHIIREYAGKGKILDFGGSHIKGVADFYKKFGANDAFYLFLEQNELPFWLKAARKLKNKIS